MGRDELVAAGRRLRVRLDRRIGGGYQTAKYLIHTDKPSDGYVALNDGQRLDLTDEAVVLLPEWADLFTDDERRSPDGV